MKIYELASATPISVIVGGRTFPKVLGAEGGSTIPRSALEGTGGQATSNDQNDGG